MKGFVKFILFLVLGFVLIQWIFTPDVNIVYTNGHHHYMDGFWMEMLVPFIIALVAIGAVFMVFGVIAAVFIAFIVAGLSILFVGLSIFWPILLAAVVFYWLFSDSKQTEV